MAGRWRGEGGQHQGARPYQEDSWALRTLGDGTLLAVVADGMGGHAGGAVASKVAVEAFVHAIEQGGGLPDGLQDANAAVGRTAAGKAELAGMGATLVAAQVRGDEVRWVSVGDSPFFMVSAGKLERLNADHSMAPQIDALVKRARDNGFNTLFVQVRGRGDAYYRGGLEPVPAEWKTNACYLGRPSRSGPSTSRV